MRYNHTFFIFLLVVPGMAQADNYVSLRGGVITGDFDSDVDSTLYSSTLTAGTQKVDYDASISARLLQMEVDGDTESGIGDIVVRGGKKLSDQFQDTVDIYGAVAAKIPTASESKGLGTGEFDYSAYLSIAKYIGQMKWNVHAGYTLIGDPPDIDYDNQLSYGIGLFRGFVNTGVFASVEASNDTTDTTQNDTTVELNFGAMRWVADDDLLGVDGSIGLTDISADYGFNIEWIHSY